MVCAGLTEEKMKAEEESLKYKDEIFCLKNEINLMEGVFFFFIVSFCSYKLLEESNYLFYCWNSRL